MNASQALTGSRPRYHECSDSRVLIRWTVWIGRVFALTKVRVVPARMAKAFAESHRGGHESMSRVGAVRCGMQPVSHCSLAVLLCNCPFVSPSDPGSCPLPFCSQQCNCSIERSLPVTLCTPDFRTMKHSRQSRMTSHASDAVVG